MQKAGGAAFVYSVGDIVYFYGEWWEYPHQFYEPYAHVPAPIVGIPGNHDGDIRGENTERDPLDGFMENFCDSTPSIPPTDAEFEFGRHTQTQPYCDWTLDLKAVRIVGLYSNVVPGGHFEDSQTEWLTAELAAAPAGKPLIVALPTRLTASIRCTAAASTSAKCSTRPSTTRLERQSWFSPVTCTTTSASPVVGAIARSATS
jgi:hypothetical protein